MSNIGCILFFLCVGNFSFSESIKHKLKVTQMEHWINHVQFSGNIGFTIVRSVVECMAQCNNNKQCLSFFYNKKLRKCVLHRKHFYQSFSTPEISEEGWKYYTAKYDGMQSSCYLFFIPSRSQFLFIDFYFSSVSILNWLAWRENL